MTGALTSGVVAALVIAPLSISGGWVWAASGALTALPLGLLIAPRAVSGSTLASGLAFGVLFVPIHWLALSAFGVGGFAMFGYMLFAPVVMAVMCCAGIVWARVLRLGLAQGKYSPA